MLRLNKIVQVAGTRNVLAAGRTNDRTNERTNESATNNRLAILHRSRNKSHNVGFKVKS
jgi:hypothetical protein